MAGRRKFYNALAGGFAEGLGSPPPRSTGTAIAPLTAKAGFFDSVTGDQSAAVWSYPSGMGSPGGGYGGYGGYGAPPVGGSMMRERRLVAGVSLDMAASNSLIWTLIETLTVNAIGSGLNLSSKVDADALGITRDMARSYGSALERWWCDYAENAAHDLTGRHTIHQLAAAMFRSWLVFGEAVVSIDWLRTHDTNYNTKVALLDPRQLDETRMFAHEQGGGWTWQGVRFDERGRVLGYWIRPVPVGMFNQIAMPVYVPKATRWGRPKILHIQQLIDPKQVRGLSPLAAALTPSRSQHALQEFTLTNALIQTAFAATVESDLPSTQALNGLNADSSLSASGTAQDLLLGMALERAKHYTANRINLGPGRINHLPPGDKFKLNKVETPGGEYEPFDRTLIRMTAKAAGSTYSDLSGDYSQESFSSSRMGSELPYRISVNRRNDIAVPFYRAIYRAAMEEAISLDAIEPPRGARSFYEATNGYTKSRWLGSGRVQPDEKKHFEAVALAISNNVMTLEEALAERGLDLEAAIEQRKAEAEMLREAGLTMGDVTKSAAPADDDDEDEPPARRGRR